MLRHAHLCMKGGERPFVFKVRRSALRESR